MVAKRTAGFSLMELMVSVAVVGILAGVAYPMFTDWIVQARRTDAQLALTRVAAQLEKFFTACTTYTLNIAGSFPNPPVTNCGDAAAGLSMPTNSPEGYYMLAITPGTTGAIATSFTITATPIGAQARDLGKCSTLTIDSTGRRLATGSEAAKCWKK